MARQTVVRPIENAGMDAVQADALCLIAHLVPAVGAWREAVQLRNALSETERQMQAASGEATRHSEMVGLLNAQCEAKRGGKTSIIIQACAIGLIAVILLIYANIYIALLLTLGSLVYLYRIYSNHKGALRRLEESRISAEQQWASAYNAFESQKEKHARLSAELGSRKKGFPALRIGDIRFNLEVTSIGGSRLLLDLSGSHQPVRVKLTDISRLQSGISGIAERADSLLQVPPMLSPGDLSGTDSDLHRLYGEESELQNLVVLFIQHLGRMKDVEAELPIIDRFDPIVRRLSHTHDSPAADRLGCTIEEDPSAASRAQAFMSSVAQSREQLERIFAEIKEVFSNLEGACIKYARARATSVNHLHGHLLQVLNRATWCNRRFYCPRTILAPEYIQQLIGISIHEAHLLPLEQLLAGLHGDPEISARLTDRPALEQQITEAHLSLQDFFSTSSGDHDQEDMSPRQPPHVQGQYAESLKYFRGLLTSAMTGSAYPVLNFSTAAQLFYDPDTTGWSSETTPYSYSTNDVIRYGSMVKAYSDVLMPLWEHLWTEKADFRKTEVFRTNESIIRMSEKESEKLIEIANQFRADLRTVRENVYLIESELKSKYAEILGFRDGTDQLGLLSPATKEQLADEKLKDLVLAEFNAEIADRFETLLGSIPQTQAESRGSVQDPIDQVREPQALIGATEGCDSRVLRVGE